MPKYSKQPFDGYTHRFIVKFKIDDNWKNDRSIDIYTDSDDYQELSYFIKKNKSKIVISFDIHYRTSKEQDDASALFIEETLNDL